MGRLPTVVPRKRDADAKPAPSRPSVLELAKEFGDVAAACRRWGLDRSGFCEWKRRFQTQGLERLKDVPPIRRSHPQRTLEPVVERIKAPALDQQAYGCDLRADLAWELGVLRLDRL